MSNNKWQIRLFVWVRYISLLCLLQRGGIYAKLDIEEYYPIECSVTFISGLWESKGGQS